MIETLLTKGFPCASGISCIFGAPASAGAFLSLSCASFASSSAFSCCEIRHNSASNRCDASSAFAISPASSARIPAVKSVNARARNPRFDNAADGLSLAFNNSEARAQSPVRNATGNRGSSRVIESRGDHGYKVASNCPRASFNFAESTFASASCPSSIKSAIAYIML